MLNSKDIRYIGVNDHEIDLFEGQYVVPNGMAYNSYVIFGSVEAIISYTFHNFKPFMCNLQKNVSAFKIFCSKFKCFKHLWLILHNIAIYFDNNLLGFYAIL